MSEFEALLPDVCPSAQPRMALSGFALLAASIAASLEYVSLI